MKKIGVVGTSGNIGSGVYMETEALLSKVGQNTGNLLFQYAVCKSISEEYLVIGNDLPWNAEVVRASCRCLIIPSANFIREDFDISGFVNFLDDVKLPLLFVGLGTQAKDYSQTDFNFHESVHRLFELFKERCPVVSLRGEFTRQLLSKYGVDNTIITGCPTNFINPDRSLPAQIKACWYNDIDAFIATGDEPWPKDLRKRDVERKMISWIINGYGIYVQQSVAPFIKYARRKNSYQSAEVPAHHEESLRKSIAPDLSNREFRGFVDTRMRVYYSVDQWLEDSARFDFSVGLRLHGNMAAWQSGTPAIWIYHDARTRELSETMALPSISYVQFLEHESLEAVRDRVGFDDVRYGETRERLRGRLLEAYSSLDLKTDLG